MRKLIQKDVTKFLKILQLYEDEIHLLR